MIPTAILLGRHLHLSLSCNLLENIASDQPLKGFDSLGLLFDG